MDAQHNEETLENAQKYGSTFDAESAPRYRDQGNVDSQELQDDDPRVQCPACQEYANQGIRLCSGGTFLSGANVQGSKQFNIWTGNVDTQSTVWINCIGKSVQLVREKLVHLKDSQLTLERQEITSHERDN